MSNIWKEDRIGSALRGENPTVITRMPSGFAVLGDTQFLPGYCLLLAYPKVDALNSLDLDEQMNYLKDTAILGRALQDVTGCARVNYGTYGNHDPFLHTHIWARYTWEDNERRSHPAWLYPDGLRSAADVQFDLNKHSDLMEKLRARVSELLE